jgi:hypothetical protein
MASRIVVHLVDDIDGSDAARTVAFSGEGTPYEIALSKDNVQESMTAIHLCVSHAWRVRSGRKRGD